MCVCAFALCACACALAPPLVQAAQCTQLDGPPAAKADPAHLSESAAEHASGQFSGPEYEAAAVKMQAIQRGRAARKEVSAMPKTAPAGQRAEQLPDLDSPSLWSLSSPGEFLLTTESIRCHLADRRPRFMFLDSCSNSLLTSITLRVDVVRLISSSLTFRSKGEA